MITDTEPGLLPTNFFDIDKALQIWTKRQSVGLFLFCDVTFFVMVHKLFNPFATRGVEICMGLYIVLLSLNISHGLGENVGDDGFIGVGVCVDV